MPASKEAGPHEPASAQFQPLDPSDTITRPHPVPDAADGPCTGRVLQTLRRDARVQNEYFQGINFRIANEPETLRRNFLTQSD